MPGRQASTLVSGAARNASVSRRRPVEKDLYAKSAERSIPLKAAEISATARGASSGIGIRGVPGFSVDGPDRFEFSLGKGLIHGWKFLGKECIEFTGDIMQFLLERVDACSLVIGRAPFIVQDFSVEFGGLLTDTFFARQSTAFGRGHNFLPHRFHFVRQLLETLRER